MIEIKDLPMEALQRWLHQHFKPDADTFLLPKSVGADSLEDDAVGTAHLQDDSVTSAELADNAVGTAHLQDDAVTSAELADNAVGNAHLQDDAVDERVHFQVPQARVFHSTSQNIPDATVTALTFNSEHFDLGAPSGQEHHESVTNPTRITCRVDGLYALAGGIIGQANATGVRSLSIRLNGTTSLVTQREHGLDTNAPALSVATVWRLVAGDYIELIYFQDSGGTLTVVRQANVSPELSIAWLSP